MAEARAIAASVHDSHLLGVHHDFEMVDTRQQSIQLAYSDNGIVIFVPRPHFVRRAVARRLWKFRNAITSSLYPIPMSIVYVIVVAYIAFMVVQPTDSWWRSSTFPTLVWNLDERFNPFAWMFPTDIRVAYLAFNVALVGLLVFMWLQRLFLRALLQYEGWLVDPPGRPSLLTKVWGILLKVLFSGGRSKFTFAYQLALPKLPIPDYKDTVKRYLDSVEPTISEEEFALVQKQAQEFIDSGIGWKLQSLLKIKSWWADNYVSDWWLKYVYLRGRSPLLINSNYYGLGFAWDRGVPSRKQTARAGGVVHGFLSFKQKLDRERVETMFIRDLVPLCMEQYKYIYSTTRVPHKTCDELRVYDSGESKHIVVHYKGLYYRVETCHVECNTLLEPAEFESQFKYIIKHAENLLSSGKAPQEVDRQVAALTTENRTKWAEIREISFSEGLNRVSLEIIEKAIFVCNLDTEAPETWSERAKLLLCGDGSNRWLDKSFQLTIFADGRVGINGEHSWGDAPVIAHVFEIVSASEMTNQLYDEAGNIQRKVSAKELAKLRSPTCLHWKFDNITRTAISDALVRARKDIDALQLSIVCHDAFGKGRIKKCRVSPDGFVQMAFQLAFYRRHNYCPLTYESSMTRLYKNGRTETIRSCTKLSKVFVEMMEGGNDREECRNALKSAAGEHSDISKLAMRGQGIDRHLFALYVSAMGIEVESPFLQDALSRSWKLSTSQLPQRQTTGLWGKNGCDQNNPDYYSPSGGFGPVDDAGYGISYMIPGDDLIFFHVSSKRTAPETDSDELIKEIFKALKDMSELFD